MIFRHDDKRSARRMRRLAVEEPVRALPGQPGDGLVQPSQVLWQLALRLNALLRGLPFELLPDDDRSLLGKLIPGSGRFLLRIASGLELLGAPIAQVRPEHLRLLRRKTRSTGNLWRIAARLKNRAMDARLLIGAFGWYLVDQVALCLEQEYEGAQTEREREALLLAFAPALLELDRVLRQSWERRRKLEKTREELAAAAKDAQEEAAAAWTSFELRHFPERVSRDALIAAAQRHMKTRAEQPESSLLAVSRPSSGPGPRIIQ